MALGGLAPALGLNAVLVRLIERRPMPAQLQAGRLPPAAAAYSLLVWPALWALWQPSAPLLAIAGGCILTRMAVGFYCERKLTQRADWNALWLALVKDLLQPVIWMLAFFGNRIEWRGQEYTVRSGGKLVKRQQIRGD